MKSSKIFLFVALAASCSSAWAWGGRGGVRVGVGIGLGPGFYWGPYDPYYYSPYYYPAYPYPYAAAPAAYVPVAPAAAYPPAGAAAPEAAAYDLKSFEEQVAKAREAVNYQYSDGDISKEQLEQAGLNIDAVQKQARDDAAAGGGFLTRSQQDALLRALWTGQPPPATASALPAPPPSAPQAIPEAIRAPAPAAPEVVRSNGAAAAGENLKLVLDLLSRLHRLLDGKLGRGDVTKAQYDAQVRQFSRIESDARSQASGGDLSSSQENALLAQLLRVQDAIQNNFIVN
jgi:hypothetical protein